MTGEGWVASKGIGVRDCKTELTQKNEPLISREAQEGVGIPMVSSCTGPQDGIFL